MSQRTFGEVNEKNIGGLQELVNQMLSRHSGKVRLQVWTSDPDTLWSAMTEEKPFALEAADGALTLYSAPSMKAVLPNNLRLVEENQGNHLRLVVPAPRDFVIYTSHSVAPRQAAYATASDVAYCYAIVTPQGLKVERKEFAMPSEGKRSSVKAFWSVLELTLL